MAGILWILTVISITHAQTRFEVKKVGDDAEKGTIQITGVSAGALRPKLWRDGKLHLLPDARRPMIAPREGAFRNIYAASVVRTSKGWRIFYGGWDGLASGNDCIYSVDTVDWLSFSDRKNIIEHGAFQHVCNVSAVEEKDDTFSLMCTAYPDARGLNKPAFFSSKPAIASAANLITLADYAPFADADINGMNALLREDGKYHLYFGNFRDFGTIYRASSNDGKSFKLDGPVLAEKLAVNDVRKIGTSYLMGLHRNRDKLHYSISADPMKFPKAEVLCSNVDDADKFIVSIGWVTDGERLLGLLYGAGSKGSLDANRIFARWLQKRIVFLAGESRIEASGALGPDRQVIPLAAETQCTVEIYDDDGSTRLGTSEPFTFRPTGVYELVHGGKESHR